MKKILLIALSILVISIGFSQIRITKPEHDFGDIFEEKGIVYTDFELINPYRDTIHIESVETSCGCTAILSTDTIIKPLSTIKLKLSYNPEGRVGLFYKSVKIQTITGKSEHNTLYLKVSGNVVPKVKNKQPNPSLIEYQVAPIYFYPVTQYDTSYLDFNYIIDFVNDLTYEVDYYQFSKVGYEIKVRNKKSIEQIEYLLRFSKYKLLRQMHERGYGKVRLFFSEPIFILDDQIPEWSLAEIKVFSINFNKDDLSTSKVKLTAAIDTDNNEYILHEKSQKPFEIDSLKAKIDFKVLEQRLLQDSILLLNVDYKVPESYDLKKKLKFEASLYNMMYKSLKSTTGIKKQDFCLTFDSVSTHASTQYFIKMWQADDLEVNTNVTYQVKQDVIVSPLLPTYKTEMLSNTDELDTSSIEFKHFWSNLIAYPKSSNYITILMESSTSYYDKSLRQDPLIIARQKSKKAYALIRDKYLRETGDTIHIEVKNIVMGPQYNKSEYSIQDYMQYEYIKLVPIYKYKRKLPIPKINARPYVVNYDYYFVGVDTNSFVFKKFAQYVIYEIQSKGMLELKLESSASNIPVDRNKSNAYLAYKHLDESKNRLNDYLKNRLVDPNRLLISEERIIVQGIPYSKKTPIVRYKKFQYVTFVPLNYLSNKN